MHQISAVVVALAAALGAPTLSANWTQQGGSTVCTTNRYGQTICYYQPPPPPTPGPSDGGNNGRHGGGSNDGGSNNGRHGH